jgi:hypothetical protein
MNNRSAPVQTWLERKLAREPFQPSKAHVASVVWKRAASRPLFAQVTLRVEPSLEFAFVDEAVWPDRRDEYSLSVRDGILDALLIDLALAPGGKFTLERVQWQSDASVPAAYAAAARQAVCELFEKEQKDGARASAV